jgi:adenylate cyclase
MSGFGNYRRDLAVLETSGGRIPQIQHNPPTASPNPVAPWISSNGAGALPSPGFGTSFYDDSSDNLSQASQLSPGFRPGTGLTGNTNITASDSPADPYFGDERRPSVASVTTASSSGSKSSANRGGIHKKLQTFFGEDFSGKDASDMSLPSHAKEIRSHSFARSHRDRNLSSATDQTQRDASPAGSRPRTPVPSSDVVPFLYQDSQVSQFHCSTNRNRSSAPVLERSSLSCLCCTLCVSGGLGIC